MLLSRVVSPAGSVMATPLTATEDNGDNTIFTCTASGGPGNTIVWIRGTNVGSSVDQGHLAVLTRRLSSSN